MSQRKFICRGFDRNAFVLLHSDPVSLDHLSPSELLRHDTDAVTCQGSSGRVRRVRSSTGSLCSAGRL